MSAANLRIVEAKLKKLAPQRDGSGAALRIVVYFRDTRCAEGCCPPAFVAELQAADGDPAKACGADGPTILEAVGSAIGKLETAERGTH